MSTQQGFEFAEICTAQTSNRSGNGNRWELQCCGTYRMRVPYYDQNRGQQCSVDKVFKMNDKQCCGNGRLISLDGSC